MKYLLIYAYEGTRNGSPTSGQGSIHMTTNTDKITPAVINDAIEIVKDEFTRKTNVQIDTIAPMGWYKFDEEESEE